MQSGNLGTGAGQPSAYSDNSRAGGANAGTLRQHNDPLAPATGGALGSQTLGNTGTSNTGLDSTGNTGNAGYGTSATTGTTGHHHHDHGHTGTHTDQNTGTSTTGTSNTSTSNTSSGKVSTNDKIKGHFTEFAGKIMKDQDVIDEGRAIKTGTQAPKESAEQPGGMYGGGRVGGT
jgi:hypothetical protein